jgi:HD-GYP domain-containing protein (c-di-GMP phosphodiesterase class II)
MRFQTRTFLGSFLPFAALLAVSFWGVRVAVLSAIRERLRVSVRDNQLALTREQARNETRNHRILQGVADNPALKAGIQLLVNERGAVDQARNTVQDQLSEIADSLGYDFILVARPRGEPIAAVVREAGGFAPLNAAQFRAPRAGFFSTDERLYELASVDILENGEQVASLTVGERFDVSRFSVPAILLQGEKLVSAQMRDLAPARVEEALKKCIPSAECEVQIQGESYLSLPLTWTAPQTDRPDDDTRTATQQARSLAYTLRSLQSMDAASAPIQRGLQTLFGVGGLVSLALTFLVSGVSSRSVASPLADLAAHLRASGTTGELLEFPEHSSRIKEIQDLSGGFNRAVGAVREGRERLTRAYVQFVGSLAQALDARDAYTAGHSRRVSEYSCAIAKAMGLKNEEIDVIRVGSLLHDLGKIGIADAVLQKPGGLTPEEVELIQQHPVIGRRILENVQGMEPYLDIVELHHENFDGTGYPRGMRGDETPLYARIVKIADAYDAMTSDRPYRRGMTHAEAVARLKRGAGTEMDSAIVEVFIGLGDMVKQQAVLSGLHSLQNLSRAVHEEGPSRTLALTPAPSLVPLPAERKLAMPVVKQERADEETIRKEPASERL